jgi:RNA polymerase sigma-70 factor (ECF subfamily)
VFEDDGKGTVSTQISSEGEMLGSTERDGSCLREVTAREKSNLSKMTAEHTLPESLAADLDGCFEDLVSHFQDRLFAFAHRITGNREDAEEVAQDAFVRAYRALGSYPAARIRSLSLRAWLYQITLNVARNKVRRKRHRVVSIGEPDPSGGHAAFEVADDPETRPDSVLEKRQRRRTLAGLVAALPERYRSTLVLRYVEGLRLEEVAQILKQPLGTVKSNAHRAIVALRESIATSRRAEVAV